ncbi:neprilysin [Spea bombifrons]|uniref:neprilysin n=1 Tax=Spea bombifrons TaxID=233779 RepID=UPI002349F768|nr:neprilysin [Spea bombifrons]
MIPGDLSNVTEDAGEPRETQSKTRPDSQFQPLSKDQYSVDIVDITHLKTKKTIVLKPFVIALVILLALLGSFAIAMTIVYVTYNDGICKTATCVKAASRIISNMDSSVEPCTNFYKYACGGWFKKHVIPEGSVRHGTIDILSDQRGIILKGALETENDNDIPAVRKTKIFYKSCIDEGTKNSRKGQPLLATLPDIFDWPVAAENWNIDQPDNGLLSPELYECTGSNKKICSAYEEYMVYLATLVRKERNLTIKDDQIRVEMKKVFELEKAIANASVPSDIRKDPNNIYMKIPVSQIENDYNVVIGGKRLNWLSFINEVISPGGIAIKKDEEVVMLASDYIKKITNFISKFNARDIQNYLAWQYVKSVANSLSQEYKTAAKPFNQLFYGLTTDAPIWKVCVQSLLEQFDDVIGRLYVNEVFSTDSKEMVKGMISEIRQVFLEMLEEQEWMDEETKKKAALKAFNMVEKIGFPEDVFDDEKLNELYAGLQFKEEEYFENRLKYKAYVQMIRSKMLREPTDPDEWTNGAAEINAEYAMGSNQIVFPAAILQPPFFHAMEPKALNYGGIGTVIGHEFTHGFDDTGKDRDENGNLINWWTEESLNKFNELSDCFVDQYGNFSWSLAGGKYLSGTGTLSENIADNGGLRQAYKAYQKYLSKSGNEHILPGLDLTSKQLFFLAFSQIWCSAYTSHYAHTSITEDEHSPGEFRVIGTLQNFPEFSEAFSCDTDDYMNPAHKCRLW